MLLQFFPNKFLINKIYYLFKSGTTNINTTQSMYGSVFPSQIVDRPLPTPQAQQANPGRAPRMFEN